jgi:hypothetical protein
LIFEERSEIPRLAKYAHEVLVAANEQEDEIPVHSNSVLFPRPPCISTGGMSGEHK